MNDISNKIFFCKLGRVSVILGALLLSAVCYAKQEYTVHAGDILEVFVWKEEGLHREVLVQPDGQFFFPLVGNVDAAGNSPTAITSMMEKKLTKFINTPIVSVSVKHIGGNKVYVLGKVKNPGEFVLSHPLDVTQALARAGGFSQFADVNKVKVLRSGSGGEKISLGFNYQKVLQGKSLQQNIQLQSGDVVLVP